MSVDGVVVVYGGEGTGGVPAADRTRGLPDVTLQELGLLVEGGRP